MCILSHLFSATNSRKTSRLGAYTTCSAISATFLSSAKKTEGSTSSSELSSLQPLPSPISTDTFSWAVSSNYTCPILMKTPSRTRAKAVSASTTTNPLTGTHAVTKVHSQPFSYSQLSFWDSSCQLLEEGHLPWSHAIQDLQWIRARVGCEDPVLFELEKHGTCQV